jgi:hypothetical protein
MQAPAHYAAMSDLNVWAGRTSNCFRVTFVGIPFGRVLAYSEIVSGRVEVFQLLGRKAQRSQAESSGYLMSDKAT